MDVSAAYRHCENVTRAQARNFSYGIRLLPGPKRRALSAVYALARRIDDISDDETAGAGPRLDGLDLIRKQLSSVGSEFDDPIMLAIADASHRYAIPLGAFDELIDGCAADVRGVEYTNFDQLVHYCRCVAGSVGRLSLSVFGTADEAVAAPVADALGVALQLTNILRDVAEDRERGRVYLPAEDLDRFGVDPCAFAADPRAFTELVRFEADRALGWYREGFALLPMLDRRSAACTAAMAGIYRGLLDRIAADPPAVLRDRVSLPGRDKAIIAVRSLIGVPA